MVKLYTKQVTKTGVKIREWECFVQDDDVVVRHGQQGGAVTEKRYTAQGKNVGRANATSPHQQAESEALAKIEKQLKSGYFPTVEQALEYEPFTPMKAQDFKAQAKKVVYPCYEQPKLNGQRLMIDADGNAWSKQGEPLELPAHWQGVRETAIEFGGLDGEVYAGLVDDGGLSLQEVVSAFRKPNENTILLKFWVYDIPMAGKSMEDRFYYLDSLAAHVKTRNVNSIVVNKGVIVHNAQEGDTFYENCVAAGYEGSVYRNFTGEYEFGKRSYNLIKRKPRQDAEAQVVSYTLDKNNEPVYTVRAINGEQAGNEFKLKMKIPKEGVNFRSAENADDLIGKVVTYEYEELSDDNIPTKACGLSVREILNNEGRW